MMYLIAPLLALIGFLGLPVSNDESTDTTMGFDSTTDAYNGSTAKGGIEF